MPGQHISVPTTGFLIGLLSLVGAGALAQDAQDAGHEGDERELKTTFSDQPAPMRLDEVPERPEPILELGDPFLGSGPISRGFTIPTGALWQPSLLVYGSYRTALQSYNNGNETFTEWVNRLDLFGNLQLSGTERLLVGIRPLDQDGEFSGYFFEPGGARQHGWDDGANGEITHLFLEGDLGQLFPGLDPKDTGQFDIGFSVGRQPIFYQEGLLINDRIDAVGITKNNIFPGGVNNLQVTALYGWNEVNRGNNVEDHDAQLFGLFTEMDTGGSTINIDAVYVYDSGRRADNTDALFLAGSAAQRIGKINTAFRALASIPTNMESPEVGRGGLLFAELSYTPAHSEDILYLNGFWGIDEFSSAARGPDAGGPLGRTGLLFAAVGLGRYGAPLGNSAQDAAGASLGFQHFFNEKRSQVVVEAGFRSDTNNTDRSAVAVAGRFETAIGRNNILRLDAFLTGQENSGPASGARVEWQIKF
ncbi:MAG: hypothetical protein H6814_07305 [Phycisphaeraceae bacterium]|nr:hypothetical protein [Phycisphaeraceae bacterium]